MINHLLMFADEAAARAALGPLGYGREGADGWQWDTSCVTPGQRVILARATYTTHVEGDRVVMTEATPERAIPGAFLTVSLAGIEPALRDLPGHACRLIGEAETGAILYTAPDLDFGLLSTAIVEPIPAGARYAFGAA